ncbi:BlaI/MecI/CopY family transcriptional regulator [Kineococcus gynurae]|uniref:BlaI/MecI/CopY family transcriptional regulator n=1 Tax=Kineococcus gynurae TaxID=452979 RepID=A0ABV5LU61_9ACTN
MARRSRGVLEDVVVDAVRDGVAETGRSLTVAQVLDRIRPDGQTSPAYTTVMTTLTRLAEKGVLQREPQGRAYAYSPAATPAETSAARTARSMRRLLDAEGRRADVLSRFVAELDPQDEELLLAVLRGTDPPTSIPTGTGA